MIAAYHGVMLLGVVMALRGLADFVEGLERLSRHTEPPTIIDGPETGSA